MVLVHHALHHTPTSQVKTTTCASQMSNQRWHEMAVVDWAKMGMGGGQNGQVLGDGKGKAWIGGTGCKIGHGRWHLSVSCYRNNLQFHFWQQKKKKQKWNETFLFHLQIDGYWPSSPTHFQVWLDGCHIKMPSRALSGQNGFPVLPVQQFTR